MLGTGDLGAWPSSPTRLERCPTLPAASLPGSGRPLCRLIEKQELSHNVRRFRFGLQTPQHRFGLPVGKHVFLYAK